MPSLSLHGRQDKVQAASLNAKTGKGGRGIPCFDGPMRNFSLMVLSLALMQGALLADAPRPNIVFIISDDQAWTDYGFMGHGQTMTPHLDQLAVQSLVFRRGYVCSSLCCPSLASLLTGRYPHQTKITGNEPPRPQPSGVNAYKDPEFRRQWQQLNDFILAQPRLPAELGKAGYLSFQTGKWWAGNFSTGGFTHGMSGGDIDHGGRHGDVGLEIGRKSMQPIADFMDMAVAQQKPFFLWYAPMLPHQPHDPPERLLRKYLDRAPSLLIAKYWAMCEWFDETCGELMQQLEDRHLTENTIVVYLADNGWIQESGKPKFRPDSKLSQYDGGLRTPIMIRWPGKIAPRMDDTPVNSVDIAPTLYDALEIARPAGLAGLNLVDKSAIEKRNAATGACFLHNAVDIQKPGKNLTYRWRVEGEWKVIVPNPANVGEANKPGRTPDAVELYHITKDPNEEDNLAEKEPAKLKELRDHLDAWWDGLSP